MLDKKFIRDSLELSRLANNLVKNKNAEHASQIILICDESIARLSRNSGALENRLIKLLLDIKLHAQNIIAEGQHKVKSPDGKRVDLIVEDVNNIKKLIVLELNKTS